MAVTATNQRVARATALLAAVQSAKGTIATNFTAAGAGRLWTSSARVPVGRPYLDFDGDMQTEVGDTSSRIRLPEEPVGDFTAYATDASVQLILKNSYGTYSGGTFSLVSQIASTQWLTLGWVEQTASGATEQFVRMRDAWIHLVTFRRVGPDGVLTMDCEFAGRVITPQALNAGGITLPTSPMMPTDTNYFTVRDTAFRRDPASANVAIRVSELSIKLDQGLVFEWDDLSQLFSVIKRGKLRPEVTFRGCVADESWVMLTNARAGTKQRYRVTSTTTNAAKTLTFDFYEMAWEFDAIGHNGKGEMEFNARATARKTGLNFLTITLA